MLLLVVLETQNTARIKAGPIHSRGSAEALFWQVEDWKQERLSLFDSLYPRLIGTHAMRGKLYDRKVAGDFYSPYHHCIDAYSRMYFYSKYQVTYRSKPNADGSFKHCN